MGDGLFFHWKGFYIMKKKLYITLLVLLLCINISGCGKTENINNSNKNSSDISSNVTENNNSSQNINTKETPGTDNSTIPEETIAPKFSELQNKLYLHRLQNLKYINYLPASSIQIYTGL